MGLFSKFRALSRPSRRSRSLVGAANSSRVHICRIEQMEPRQYLSASAAPDQIHVGAVYHDLNNPDPSIGSLFYISWNGGADGTQLTQFTIHTNNNGGGSLVFHTQVDTTLPNGYLIPGVDKQLGDNISLANPINAPDGGTVMTVNLSNFQRGQMLVVDATLDHSQNDGTDPEVDGFDFANSTFTATFTNSQCYSVTVTGTFTQDQSPLMAVSNDFTTEGLTRLPSENYTIPAQSAYTDVAYATAQQAFIPTISGTVFEDPKAGLPSDTNPTGPGVGNVTIDLLDSTGKQIGQTQTNSSGNYSFVCPGPGTYSVVEDATTIPADDRTWDSFPGLVNGNNDATKTSITELTSITVANNDKSVQNNFSLAKPVTLSGIVYYDVNDYHSYQVSVDPGLGNTAVPGGVTVQVQYYSTPGATAVTTDVYTNSDGTWSYTGLPGEYVVSALPVSGYDAGWATAGTITPAGTTNLQGTPQNPGETVNGITLLSGQAGSDYDFGELRSNISGKVFLDVYGDQTLRSDDPPLGSIKLTLYEQTAGSWVSTNDTTQTDPTTGEYSFNNLTAGTYRVVEDTTTFPSGDTPGASFPGSLPTVDQGQSDGPAAITNVQLPSGTAATDYDFCAELPATISGTVYVQNQSGVKTPHSGVSIQLLDSNNNPVGAPKTTDANGNYSFTGLAPGTYSVEETVPNQYSAVSDAVGTISNQYSKVAVTTNLGDQASNTLLEKISLPNNAAGINYDFVLELIPASISGTVFQDGAAITLATGTTSPDLAQLQSTGHNGLLSDSNVTPISGLKLILADGNGKPLLDASGNQITKLTDQNGNYQFTGLDPSQSYSVLLDQPQGYIQGIAKAGSDGGVVVNNYAQPSASVASGLAVTSQNNDAIVRISVNPGDAATGYNFSELVTQPSSPTKPTTPTTPTGGGSFSPPPELPDLPGPQHAALESPLPGPPPAAPSVPSHSQYMAGGGASNPPDNTWHLSVVDGGDPRQLQGGSDTADDTSSTFFNASSWTGSDMQGGEFILADRDGVEAQHIIFGMPGATPVAGDWNGDGRAKVGVFLDGQWFLDLNGDGQWDDGDLWARLGHEGDQPVTGDWDGDGKTDIGIFGPAWSGDPKALVAERGQPHPENRTVGRAKNIPPDPQEATDGMRVLKKSSHGRIRADVIDHVFRYGSAGDRAVVGDWKGTGVYTIGVFREGTWYLDINGDGKFGPGDMVVQFGQAGDIPVVGDWTGDGVTKLGVFRNGTYYLDTNNNHQLDANDKVIALGKPGDRPVIGDFDGRGVDEVGVYRDRGGASTSPSSAGGRSQAAAPAPVPVQVTAGK